MILHRRKEGSQRTHVPFRVDVLNFNTAGQGGENAIVLFAPDVKMYYTLELENDTEYREFLSAVQKASFHV